MTALIVAGAAAFVILGIWVRDVLMVAVGIIALALPVRMFFTQLRQPNRTARDKADLIADFAAEQEEKEKHNG